MHGARIQTIRLAAALLLCALVYLGSLYYSAHGAGWDGYIRMHEEYPMVALPETSLPEMLGAVQELEKSEAVAVLPFSDDQSGSWHRGVYPIAFLEASAQAEEKRRTLLKERTSENAEAYHVALLALLHAYDAALAHDSAALDVGKKTTIQSFGGITSSTYIMSVLESGRKGLIAMEKEEGRRYSCAHGSMLACAHWRYWPTPSAAPLRTLDTSDIPSELPDNVLRTRNDARAFIANLDITLSETTTVALTNSKCYPSFAPAYYDVAKHPSILSGVTAGYFTILNDSFFYDLVKIPVQYNQAYYKTGAAYSNQSFNAYICQDFGQEVSMLLSIQNTQDVLQKNPIVPRIPYSSYLLEKVLDAQHTLSTEDVPNERSYKNFIEYTERLLDQTNWDTLVRVLGTDQAETLRDLVLASHTGTARFERVLGYFDDLSLGTYVTGRLDPYRTSVFFMLRGGISSLFMVGNETGPFPQGTSLFQSHSTHELAPTGYTLLSYEHDLKSSHTLSSLLALDERAHTIVFAPFTVELRALRK